MLRALLVVAVSAFAVALVACGAERPRSSASSASASAAAEPTPPPVEAAIDSATQFIAIYEGFKDQLCACIDKPCHKRLVTDVNDWQRSHSDEVTKLSFTTAQVEDIGRIDQEMLACKRRFVAMSFTIELFAKFANFRDQFCSCHDQACVESVETKMGAWFAAHEAELKEARPTRAEDELAFQIETQIDECKARVTPAP